MRVQLLILVSLFSAAAAYPLNYSSEEALEILKKNCPDSYAVVAFLKEIPKSYGTSTSIEKGFIHWLDKDNPVKYLTSFSTGVHECFHAYNSFAGRLLSEKGNQKLKPGGTAFCYYINQKENFIVMKTESFPASEMAKSFTLGMKMGRFSTYIYPSSEDQSTQMDGVYALLDEWNAYYLGTKTLLELIPLMQKELAVTAENWKEYFLQLNSDFIAYVEFKLYILNYLIYAQKNYPDQYQNMIENTEFLKAYRAVDQAYSQEVDNYFAKKELLIRYLNQNGLEVTEDETAIYFGSEGIGNYGYKHKKMLQEFQKEKYREVLEALIGK